MLSPITLVPFQAHEAVTLYNNYRLVIATSYRRLFNNMIVTMQNDCSKFNISHYIMLQCQEVDGRHCESIGDAVLEQN